jgi:hypothetical protein
MLASKPNGYSNADRQAAPACAESPAKYAAERKPEIELGDESRRAAATNSP